jgi:L-cysteine:1D-myo-inositol 2-amino-2-deoxy-alpha-D-glucopyranoside ligase
MRAWASPPISDAPTRELGPAPALRLHDTRSGKLRTTMPGDLARIYVCGITPYDATHMGHSATYTTFDLAIRAWRAAGHGVRYVQNVTDVDDPLLERARDTGEDWVALAERETELFREDMAALSVIPPEVFAGAVESIPIIVELIEELRARGAVYELDGDLYYAVASDPHFAEVSGWTRQQMLEVFADRGGDPERAGKRDPLDALVWQHQREGDPGWDSPFGIGRPGWHVECSAIARTHLGEDFDVQGGGSDLIFPHHEMSAGHAQVAYPGSDFAQLYAHQGMVGYEGHKMSKSRGNLVLVSRLRAEGVDPGAIRLALNSRHYRTDWEWTASLLDDATKRLAAWRDAVARDDHDDAATRQAAVDVRAALADDLDAPRALEVVDRWVSHPGSVSPGQRDGVRPSDLMADVVQASLGVDLRT